MNRDTGELYKNLKDAEKEIEERFRSNPEKQINKISKLIPLDQGEYKMLKGMTRAERRRWARENKKEKRK